MKKTITIHYKNLLKSSSIRHYSYILFPLPTYFSIGWKRMILFCCKKIGYYWSEIKVQKEQEQQPHWRQHGARQRLSCLVWCSSAALLSFTVRECEAATHLRSKWWGCLDKTFTFSKLRELNCTVCCIHIQFLRICKYNTCINGVKQGQVFRTYVTRSKRGGGGIIARSIQIMKCIF
jgi:hypothetical protein